MNLNVLHYVVSVYEEKSMTKAARVLFVAQPSLSQSIRLLEEELGVKLFERGKTPLRVTPAGEIFVHWAKQVLISEQRMKDSLADVSTFQQRKLVIGVSPYLCKEVLPEVLQKFYASVKDCSVTLKEYEAGELERQLNMERIDLVVDLPNPDTARYDSLPIAEVNILLAAPKSIGLSEDRSGEYPAVAMLDLPKLKFIALAENVCFTEILSDIFKRLHASPIIAMECQSPQIAHTMVSFDMGVTLLPEYCFVHNKLPNVVYYTIHGYPISHTVTVLHRKDRPLSEDADRFLSILKEEITGGTL